MNGGVLVRPFVMKCIMWVRNLSLVFSKNLRSMSFQVARFVSTFSIQYFRIQVLDI